MKLDIMKQALMKKMNDLKGGASEEGDAVDQDGVKKGSDLAPKLKGHEAEVEGEGDETELELPAEGVVIEGQEHEATEEDLLKQILQALSGGNALQGRDSMSLSERAGAGAQGKLAEMAAKAKMK